MKSLLFVVVTIVAAHLSPALAMEKDIVERAKVVFTEQLELRCTPSTQTDWIAEDAVYQYALSHIDVRLHLEGRKAIADHLCALSQSSPIAKAENIRYFPTLNRDIVYVQFDLVPVDGVGKRGSPLAIIEMRDNQIASFMQLSRSPGSLKVLEATMGGIN